MRRKKIWLGIGVAIAVVLLIYWLFAGTLLQEEANPDIAPMAIEQN
ncbi:MAG: hypothetical protein RRZ65_05440 [Tannerellaceae bacterium]